LEDSEDDEDMNYNMYSKYIITRHTDPVKQGSETLGNEQLITDRG
jgi:hypothetical protein